MNVYKSPSLLRNNLTNDVINLCFVSDFDCLFLCPVNIGFYTALMT